MRSVTFGANSTKIVGKSGGRGFSAGSAFRRRRRIAELTRQGSDLAETLITLGPLVSGRILADFTPEDRETLLALLERLGNRKEAGS